MKVFVTGVAGQLGHDVMNERGGCVPSLRSAGMRGSAVISPRSTAVWRITLP